MCITFYIKNNFKFPSKYPSVSKILENNRPRKGEYIIAEEETEHFIVHNIIHHPGEIEYHLDIVDGIE